MKPSGYICEIPGHETQAQSGEEVARNCTPLLPERARKKSMYPPHMPNIGLLIMPIPGRRQLALRILHPLYTANDKSKPSQYSSDHTIKPREFLGSSLTNISS